MNQIIIEDLEVRCRIGVPEEERAQPQRLLITVIMDLDFSKAAQTDNLEFTINYFEVCQRIKSLTSSGEWKLLEKLAHDICSMILNEFHPNQIEVTLKKFIIPEARWVAVRMVH